MRLLSHSLLNGYPNLGEGMAIQQAPDGRRIMWLAHENTMDYTAVDVTDPAKPSVIVQQMLPHDQMRSNSLAVVGDILYLARQTAAPGLPNAGMDILDISTPESPRLIGSFDVSGPTSRGAHCLWCVDGRYAHLATSMPDARPRHPLDDQFYVIVDVGDPTKPTEAGRWWIPGTMESDAEPPPERHEPDMGYGAHNTAVYPQRPDRAYCGFKDGGAVILDITDVGNPKQISRMDYHPPMPPPAFTHTVLPLFGRDLALVSDESMVADGADWPKLVWLMDISAEENPVTLSTLPLPDAAEMAKRPGRFGAHNIHENQPLPTSLVSEQLVFGTYFSAGLLVHDISNPLRPVEVAHFIPEYERTLAAEPVNTRSVLDGMNINDVYVDENRVIYAVDRQRGGLYILDMTV